MSFWLWDEQVALDYLASLPMVDSTRLGVVGCSGGGKEPLKDVNTWYLRHVA
jgi:cephalosporin-C deacetylase-like acetyl esterase